LLCLLGLPYFLFKLAFEKRYQYGVWERLGFLSKDKKEKILDQCPIWFHAVSVGEASAVYPLYKAFKEKYPHQMVLFSTTTKTGQDWMEHKLFSKDVLIYFPIDLYWSVRRVLNVVRPTAFIAVETEIWPNFWWLAQKYHQTKLALINGRLSDRSFHQYTKVRFFLKHVLNKVSMVSCQTERDQERFIALGAPSARVAVGGNLKFEVSINDASKKQLGVGDAPILVGGSTHAGEEEILIRCYQELKSFFPSLCLILAPRHPERFKEVENLILQMGEACFLESHIEKEPWPKNSILLIDGMGKLPSYYSLATIVFMGKSLTAEGGQNFLEPAALGKAIIFGPHMENFRQSAEEFLKKEAVLEVRSENELKNALQKLLDSTVLRGVLEKRAKELVNKNKGALALNLKYIETYVQNH